MTHRSNPILTQGIRMSIRRLSRIVLAVYDKEMAEEAYKSALAAAGQRGTGIFNATRGGELEVFPRIRLEQVI